MGLMGAIAEVPGFFEVYWGPRAAAQAARFAALTAGVGFVDMPSMMAILLDFLPREAEASEPLPFAGPVTLVLGRHDPLVDTDADAAALRAVAPQAELRVVDAGHFVHLERPAAEWFPLPLAREGRPLP